MPTSTIRAVAFLAVAGLAAAPGFARDQQPKPKSGKPSAPPGGAGTGGSGFGQDQNYGCDLSHATLTAWKPGGSVVPASVASKLKLLATYSASGGPSVCKNLTPRNYIVSPDGGGNIKTADLVVATQDLPIYRAYSKKPFTCSGAAPAAQYGAWWSFQSPKSKHDYRVRNAVCPSWNDFSMKETCTLKKGTVVAVGPTQSKTRCDLGPNCAAKPADWPVDYKASNELQVHLNLRSRLAADIGKFLTNCKTSAWPGAEFKPAPTSSTGNAHAPGGSGRPRPGTTH